MPKTTRKVLKFDKAALVKHLRNIANHGLVEQGGEVAIRAIKDIAYWQKGTDKISLSDQEAGKLIFH